MNEFLVITGGMGTGKSTVLKLFQEHGFFVINSDDEVSHIFSLKYHNYPKIAKDFDLWLGTDFSNSNGIDKKILRKYLEKTTNGFPISLNIVKPYIKERIFSLSEQHKNDKFVVEIPLLFEANMQNDYKNILVVTADIDVRIKRIQKRQPHLSLEQIEQTIHNQLPEDVKIKHSNFHLKNNTTIDELKKSFDLLLPKILKIQKLKQSKSSKHTLKTNKIK